MIIRRPNKIFGDKRECSLDTGEYSLLDIDSSRKSVNILYEVLIVLENQVIYVYFPPITRRYSLILGLSYLRNGLILFDEAFYLL